MKKVSLILLISALHIVVFAATNLASNQILLLQGNYGLIRWEKYDFPFNVMLNEDETLGDYWLVKKMTEPVLTYKIANEDYRWQEANNQVITFTGDSSLVRWTANQYPIPPSAKIVAEKQIINPEDFKSIVIKNCKFYVLVGDYRFEMDEEGDFKYVLNNLVIDHVPSEWSIVYDDNDGVQQTIANGGFVDIGSAITVDFFFDFGVNNITASITKTIVMSLDKTVNLNSYIKIFSNSSVNKFKIETSNDKIDRVQVINLEGQSMKMIDVNATSYYLNLEDLHKGVYILRVKSGTLIKNEIICIKK
ncbi:MAG: T9SS type A sorting domain-containing protein [Pigmentiphaga sp.]|nr:T9SS type A sorting domain-containing protein [Pigmentiphaga sp.]